jgi:hypothetical protein
MLQGWARAMQGQDEEGMAQLRQGLAAWQATGARGAGPHYLAMLAEVHGQAEEGCMCWPRRWRWYMPEASAATKPSHTGSKGSYF